MQQNEPGQPQPQLLLMLQDDQMGYCNLDGSLKLHKRKRQPTDEPRPAKVCCTRGRCAGVESAQSAACALVTVLRVDVKSMGLASGAVCIQRAAAAEMLAGGDGWWCWCAEAVSTCFIHIMSRESTPTNAQRGGTDLLLLPLPAGCCGAPGLP